MCGIAGYAGWHRPRDIAEAHLTAMCSAIIHRGPDEEGHHVGDGVAIGMRRLSVIDVSGGSQPMSNETGDVHVVFNGEIYNHRALREALKGRHEFHTRSDTEVLVHLYEEDGPQLVQRLRGMFAFAIWDDTRQRLTVGRDRLGIKPLYYWEHDGGVAFGSELGTLQQLSGFPADLDIDAVHEFLALGYVPDPKCVYAGVQKLPPGHLLLWDREHGVRIEQFWSPVRPELPVRDEREAIEELRRLLADAVLSHLESDVSLGAFLSGGIDSSTVVAEMTRVSPDRVETFSIGFDDPKLNEAPHAKQVAAALGTKHHELIVRPDALEMIDEVVEAYDEPFGDSSAIPTLIVSKLARQHVTVALSGDGGDELFGGYTRYARMEGVRELRPEFARRLARAAALSMRHSAKGRNKLLDLSRGLRGRYAATVAQALPIREGGTVKNVAAHHALDALLSPYFDRASDRDFLTQMTLVDLETYLPGDILTKVDRASMRFSLEARVPMLDHPLVEFAVSLPGHFKRREGVGKWILRQAIRGIVPDIVLDHPKQGFAVPLQAWFKGPLRPALEALRKPDRRVLEYVDRATLVRLIDEHLAGPRDHSHYLWRILVFDLWLNRRPMNAARWSAA